MNLDKRLELQAKIASDNHKEWTYDTDAFMDFTEADVRDFQESYQASSVAAWAVNKQIKSSYDVAKKIIDTI